MSTLRNINLRTLSLLDQVMFSAANFVLTILFVKNYADTQVAGYGIGLSIALIIQSTQRNCYVVQNSILAPAIFCRRAPKVLGQHLMTWAVIITIECVIAALLLLTYEDGYHRAILGSVIVCSLIYAQLDFDRVVLTKHGRIMDSLIASAAFLLLAGILFFVVPLWHIPFWVTLLSIGCYAVLKIARLLFLVGMPDLFWGARLAKKDFRRYFASSLLGMAGFAGHSHGPLFVLGYVAPALHSAAFVAMRGLMQPLMVIIRSLDVIDKNLMQASTVNTPASLRAVMLRQLFMYAALSSLAVAAIFIMGPWVVELVYGSKYLAFSQLLAVWSIIFALFAITCPMETVIVKLGRLNQFNALRLMAGATGLLLAVILCPRFGVWGAIGAHLGGMVVSVLCALWLIRDILLIPQPAHANP